MTHLTYYVMFSGQSFAILVLFNLGLPLNISPGGSTPYLSNICICRCKNCSGGMEDWMSERMNEQMNERVSDIAGCLQPKKVLA